MEHNTAVVHDTNSFLDPQSLLFSKDRTPLTSLFKFDENDLNKAIGEAVNSLKEAASQKGLSLKVRLNTKVAKFRFDHSNIVQAIKILLKKALESAADGKISVRAGVAYSKEKKVAMISVCYAGASQSEEKHEELFYVTENAFRKALIRELDLVTCREIVEAHGGRVWLESTNGFDRDFVFTLPIH